MLQAPKTPADLLKALDDVAKGGRVLGIAEQHVPIVNNPVYLIQPGQF